MWFLKSEWLKGPVTVFLLAITADVRSYHDLPSNGNTRFQKAEGTNKQCLWQNAILLDVALLSPLKPRTILVWWHKGDTGIHVSYTRLTQQELGGRKEQNAWTAAARYPKKFSCPSPSGEKSQELGIWARGFPLVLAAPSCHMSGSSAASLQRSSDVKDRSQCRKHKSVLL